MYNIFPNCSLTFGADGVLLQRMTPHPTDPEQCVFDHWYYAFTPPNGEDILRAQTNVRVDAKGVEQDFLTTETGLWASSQTGRGHHYWPAT